jgi:hypothetical protein
VALQHGRTLTSPLPTRSRPRAVRSSNSPLPDTPAAMPSSPAPLPDVQRTARPCSRSRAGKGRGEGGEAFAFEATQAFRQGGHEPFEQRGRVRGGGAVDLGEPGDAGARVGDALLPQVDADAITATRPLPRGTVSISTPPSFLSRLAGADEPEIVGPLQADPQRSAGRGSRASARATPTASERPEKSVPAASGQAREKVSEAPGVACQPRPRRPRRRSAVRPPALAARARSRRRRCRPRRAGRRWSIPFLRDPLDLDRRQPARAHFFLGASMVPRHFGLPQWHANCCFAFFVCRPSSTRPVVVVQLLARRDVAQRLDEHPAGVFVLVGFAVRIAGVIDPFRRAARCRRR